MQRPRKEHFARTKPGTNMNRSAITLLGHPAKQQMVQGIVESTGIGQQSGKSKEKTR
jgi:hypothetical protein